MEIHIHPNSQANTLKINMELEKEFIKEINSITDINYAKALIKRLYSDIRKYRDKQGFAVYLKDTMDIAGLKK